jgi:hypothetical protein
MGCGERPGCHAGLGCTQSRFSSVAERRRTHGSAEASHQYGLDISVQGRTFGSDTVAVKLHNSGEHNGKTLDQDVVNVLTIRGGKVASVSANLSDVSAFDDYFS